MSRCIICTGMYNLHPCPVCRLKMGEMILLIGIDPELSRPGWDKETFPSPRRTGDAILVTKDYALQVFGDDQRAWLVSFGWLFVSQSIINEIRTHLKKEKR